jgi:hypothetical protein
MVRPYASGGWKRCTCSTHPFFPLTAKTTGVRRGINLTRNRKINPTTTWICPQVLCDMRWCGLHPDVNLDDSQVAAASFLPFS